MNRQSSLACQESDSWDGIFRGQHMEPGVYVWYLTADVDVCGRRNVSMLNKGDVTIVR